MKVIDLIKLLKHMPDRSDVFFIVTDEDGDENVIEIASVVEKEDGTVVLR